MPAGPHKAQGRSGFPADAQASTWPGIPAIGLKEVPMPLDRESIGDEFKRRADLRAEEIARLAKPDKMRVDDLRQAAKLEKERVRITHERLREEKEQRARDSVLSGASPRDARRQNNPGTRWKPLPGAGVTPEEAEASAKRYVEEQHQLELAKVDEKRDRKIDEIVALNRMRNPAQQREREHLDLLKQEKQRDQDVTRTDDRKRSHGRGR